MKRITQTIFVLSLVLAVLALAAGCADSKRSISIALSPSASQSIDNGQTVQITATLTNDTQAQGVTWSLNGAGTLSGQTKTSVTYSAPSAASSGNSTATITATSVSQNQATTALSVTVSPMLSINAPALPDAVVGTAYSQSVTGSGGVAALTYSLNSGALPVGLSLNASTGAISGTPTGSAGTSTFTIKVTDSSAAGAQSAVSTNISIKVDLPAGPSINTNSLPAGTVGVAYNNPVSATGGIAPLAYSVSAGALPAGLSLGSSSGIITGTPTTQGSATFTVKVTDSATPTAQTATKQFTIVINPSLSITASSLPNGTVGTSYSTPLTEAGGVSPFSWSITVGTLPAGLTLDTNTGAISGTPTAVGTSNFTVQVVDSGSPHQSATKAFSITINSATAGVCGTSNTGAESLLNGQYAMIIEGFNSSGAVVLGATFDADGAGHIAKNIGIEDLNTNSGQTGTYNLTIDPAQSSYTLGSDHRGCMILVNSLGFQEHFAFAVMGVTSGVATRGQVIETTVLANVASGTLLKQDTSAFAAAKLNGNYAFGVSAPQSNQQKFSAVGVFHLDGSAAVTGQWDTNLAGDLNSSGSTFPASAITIASGMYTVAANGRGSLAFTPTGDSQHTAIIYVVNSSSFLLMSSGLQPAASLFQGSATLQTGGPYSNSSMNAVSVFGTSGISASSGANTVVRIGKIDPANTYISYFYNDAGGSSSPGSTTGSPFIMSVDTTGRGVLSSGGGFAVFSLTAPNQGYILFMRMLLSPTVDSSASIGQFWPQTGGPYNDLTFGGAGWSFGSSGADSSQSVHTDGWASYATSTFSEVSAETGATDTVGTATNFNTPFSDMLSVNPVYGVLGWYDSTLTTQSKFGIIINSKTFIAVDSVTSTAPTLLFYEAQQ